MANPAQMTPQQIAAILNGPAMIPPGDETSHLQNPPDGKAIAMFTIIASLVVVTLVTFMRLYCKAVMMRQFALEDYALVFGFTAFAVYYYPLFEIVDVGVLVHQWNYRLTDTSKYAFNIHLASVLYCLTIAPVKASILLQYVNIFVPRGARNFMFWTSYIFIAITIVWYIIAICLEVIWCMTTDSTWNPLVPDTTCYRLDDFQITIQSFNVLTDLVILILPQRVIWSLQMPRKRKVAISLLFIGGIFACLSAIMKLVEMIKLTKTDDVTYVSSAMGLWSSPEITVGFIVACVPVAPKFVREFKLASILASSLKSILGLTRASGRDSYPGRSWPSSGTPKTRRDGFIRADDGAIPLKDTRDDSNAHSLASLSVAEQGGGAPVSITRTVQVSQSNQPMTQQDHRWQGDQQHPWKQDFRS